MMNLLTKYTAWLGIVLLAGWWQAAAAQETMNIELVKTLDAKGAFIRLEERSLFLTTGVNTNAQQAGYWFDAGSSPASPTLGVCPSIYVGW